MKTIAEFEKRRRYLVCVDSDGCAMDTMDVKHYNCFGPCMVAEWGLCEWEGEILFRWNEINLYTLTRGINRFRGLALALSEIDKKYTRIEGIDALVEWAENSPELSNSALARALEKSPDKIALRKALAWSEAVNAAIVKLPEEKKLPFEGVRDALRQIHERADITIISSANLDAVLEEWEKHGLLDSVDAVLAQNSGSKAFCIGEMLKKGYSPTDVVMCGDALGDKEAAEKNGVYFFPILVRREKESWREFTDVALSRLIQGEYGGEYQEEKNTQFYKNLGEK